MQPPALSPEDSANIQQLLAARLWNEQEQLRLLCRVLKRVIVENFNYCNRKCTFCTNRLVDRKSRFTEMPDDLFIRIFDQLVDGRYGGTVFFGRYSEPLAHPMVYERVRLVRDRLPTNRISLNTNGDYLIERDLHRLAECGLSDMKIMCYLPNGATYTPELATKLCWDLLNRTGLDGVLDKASTQNEIVFHVSHSSRLHISVHAENYSIVGLGSDRGGVVTQLGGGRRRAPCYAPFFELNVDYSGDVVPCCNMNSDVPAHRPYVMGNVRTDSIATIYFSEGADAFRRCVLKSCPDPAPCARCQYYWPNRVVPGDRRALRET